MLGFHSKLCRFGSVRLSFAALEVWRKATPIRNFGGLEALNRHSQLWRFGGVRLSFEAVEVWHCYAFI